MMLLVFDPRSVFNLRRHSVGRTRNLVAALGGLLLLSPASAIAQSGSVGGSIGKEDKSISGSQEPARSLPTQPAQPTSRAKSSSRASGGGGFDGAWAVSSVGVTCSGGSSTAVVVTSGRIIGQGVTGQVSPNGAVNTVGNSNGITIISTGKLSGRSGSGSFRQSDGCTGRWTAMKQ